MRALTGIWPALRGASGSTTPSLPSGRRTTLGRNLGYLPQDVALMDATIEENISRFEPKADPGAVIAAAKAAGVHEMIVRLPDGYRTQLGPQGMALSAGQRQRIGLARALYRDPFLVVMDEPNSNLDARGRGGAFGRHQGHSERGGIAIVIAHRPSALVAVDQVAVIQNGRMTAFGPKSEILRPQAIRRCRHPAWPTACSRA